MNPFNRMKKVCHAEAARLLKRLNELRGLPALRGIGYSEEIADIQKRLDTLSSQESSEEAWETVQRARHRDRPQTLDLDTLSSQESSEEAWETVQRARHRDRPQTLDYVHHIFNDLEELHGDRLGGDDPAVIGGLATLNEMTVMLIGQQKGRDLKERQARNFGMAGPEGYRKAERLARLAEKFELPVVTLVDTPGTYPGVEAEKKGQAAAIASILRTFSSLKVPTVAVVIGEGGSGGALALALCDRVYMLENSIYSVITPEGCAAILWRDSGEAAQAAEALGLTAPDLLRLELIDGVILEPRRGAHKHHRATAKKVQRQIRHGLEEVRLLTPAERIRERRLKYLAMGRYESGVEANAPALVTKED